MTHAEVWKMIDEFAKSQGISTFRLGRIAGLNDSSLLPGKRFIKGTQEKWPSTKTIAKILNSTKTSLKDLMRIYLQVQGEKSQPMRQPVNIATRLTA